VSRTEAPEFMKTKQKEPCSKQGPIIFGRPTCRRDTPTPSIPSQARLSSIIIPQTKLLVESKAKILTLKFSEKLPFPTSCVPRTQSNRRPSVDWSSSKAAAYVVYCVRTFRHGFPKSGRILALSARAIGLLATGAGQRGPCRLITLLLTHGPGSLDPGPGI